MNFRPRHEEEPMEINLIPLIDVLLVILVFLAASTSFTKQSQLQLDLPKAQVAASENNNMLDLNIDASGTYSLGGNIIELNSPEELATLILQARKNSNTGLNIAADKNSAHGAVVLALEAARIANIEKINFLTEM